MKNIFLLLFAAFSLSAQATDTTQFNPELKSVKVFFSGAELHHKGDFAFQKGIQFIRVEGLPVNLEKRSIQVKGIDGVTIRSVRAKQKQESLFKSGDQIVIEDELEKIDIEIMRVSAQYTSLTLEEDLILKNQRVYASPSESRVVKIQESAKFYQDRVLAIRKEKIDLKLKIKDLETKKSEYLISQGQANTQKKLSTYALIEVLAQEAGVKEIELSYFLSSAGWEPEYDFRVNSVGEPLLVDFKANIVQSTGIDWKDVKITLSTANPSQSAKVPVLDRWYITRRQEDQRRLAPSNPDLGLTLEGVVYDEHTQEPIPTANVVVKQGDEVINGTASDFDGNFRISNLRHGTFTVEVSFIGYATKTIHGVYIHPGGATNLNIELSPDVAMLGMVEVVEYSVPLIDPDNGSGRTITREEIHRSPQRNISSIAADARGARQSDEGEAISNPRIFISNTLKKAMISNEYEIEDSYTIPSNREEVSLRIQQDSLPAFYEFHVVPRVSSSAFLTAHILDWQYLNLLSANANIFYQGTYQGKTYLNTEILKDTLEVSLGRDESVVVSRESDKENLKLLNIGKQIKEEIAWKIEVYNGKSSEITLVIEDQYPFSNNSSILITPGAAEGAKVDAVRGIIRWKTTLGPQEKLERNHSYILEYPKEFQYLFN